MKELDKALPHCLTYQEACKTPINLYWSWCCEQWVVHMVSNIQREQPVVGTVLEKVEDGHCSMREPVHKQCFQESFSIVQCPTASCNAETPKRNMVHVNMWTTNRKRPRELQADNKMCR
jgi:hypothetical protein